jgi:hypothetical protein
LSADALLTHVYITGITAPGCEPCRRGPVEFGGISTLPKRSGSAHQPVVITDRQNWWRQYEVGAITALRVTAPGDPDTEDDAASFDADGDRPAKRARLGSTQ